ncbi:MAG: S-adenosylmethionine:tRNA ribosyltransferase-isomerase [Fimbriimonadaceae bacterium]
MPGTTMLAMVASFIGLDGLRSSYRDAVSHQYRFLSFGDSMFIEPACRGV